MLTSQLDFLLWFNYSFLARKHINEHRVVHDYGLCVMVKTARDGDLDVRANLVSKLVACHQHQRELAQCHKMCLPDLQSLLEGFNLSHPRQNGGHFTDDIFNCIFLNEKVRISIRISLKFVPKCPNNNKSAMATSHYLKQC